MNKTKPETHQACRSLLQKAVRRGNRSLTSTVAHHLRDIGDMNWLKTRTFVIAFEECWPSGAYQCTTTSFDNLLDMLLNVAQAVKRKDAAGLGSLAFEHSRGDYSVLAGSSEDEHIIFLSRALKEADLFWNWATQKSAHGDQFMLVETAHKAYRRGGWPWDRAFMQAAAYLALNTDDFTMSASRQEPQEDFPYWIALDKHTFQGKQALREAAKVTGIPVHQLSWISFYFEGARLNEVTASYWWSREIQWRLKRFGLDYEQAQSIWDRARPIVREILQSETEWLQQHLDEQAVNQHPLPKMGQEQLWGSIPAEFPSDQIIVVSSSTSQPAIQHTLPGF